MKIKFLFGIIFLTLFACREDNEKLALDFLQPGVPEMNAIDYWIKENYTDKYNIAIQYRWNPFEVPVSKDLVPVKEDKVIPAMTIVKQVWIDPYVANASEAFIKAHAPKQFVLIGSAEYNNDGTYVLGEAEAGRKITLFVINKFDNKNIPAVKQMLHTIHHEFGHILHQTILYPREYKQITSFGYTASWYNSSDEVARNLGFISPYARASADEDFVEMISTMLVEGKAGYEDILKSTSDEGRALLRKKEAMVVAYFQQAWDIDFYALQISTNDAITTATK
jgi:substrate import-associated zinc metallohydrolase lipoprotein